MINEIEERQEGRQTQTYRRKSIKTDFKQPDKEGRKEASKRDGDRKTGTETDKQRDTDIQSDKRHSERIRTSHPRVWNRQEGRRGFKLTDRSRQTGHQTDKC